MRIHEHAYDYANMNTRARMHGHALTSTLTCPAGHAPPSPAAPGSQGTPQGLPQGRCTCGLHAEVMMALAQTPGLPTSTAVNAAANGRQHAQGNKH